MCDYDFQCGFMETIYIGRLKNAGNALDGKRKAFRIFYKK
ncbi:hypothetical protein BSM4216_0412 [Bacillus smithii]|nr:hypothetical protein BSM4216_0412 [Bacillus smithii]